MRKIRSFVALIAVAWPAMGTGWQSPPDFSGQWVAEPEVVPAPAAAEAAGAPRGSMGSGWGSPITIIQFSSTFHFRRGLSDGGNKKEPNAEARVRMRGIAALGCDARRRSGRGASGASQHRADVRRQSRMG